MYGTAAARFIATDTFEVALTARDKLVHSFTATRLADEQLRVCDREKRCATLVREFDAYHHDLN